MKMDGRVRVECQNWEKKNINVIFLNCLSWIIRQKMNSTQLLKFKRGENMKSWEKMTVSKMEVLEREHLTSL